MGRTLEPFNNRVGQLFLAWWPLWLGLGLLLAVRLAVLLYQERRLARSGIREVDGMDGIRFEQYLTLLFRQLGYTVQRTPPHGDFGADLILVKDGVRTAVQAKRYAKNVGVKAVQEVVAAQTMYRCNAAMVVTNSGYTQQASTLARSNNVVLWDRDQLITAMLKTQGAATRAEHEKPALKQP